MLTKVFQVFIGHVDALLDTSAAVWGFMRIIAWYKADYFTFSFLSFLKKVLLTSIATKGIFLDLKHSLPGEESERWLSRNSNRALGIKMCASIAPPAAQARQLIYSIELAPQAAIETMCVVLISSVS